MGEKYFHYTSRQLAQEIVIAKKIRPRSNFGRIYLTQDTFSCGADAVGRLSIVGKPLEVGCVIPAACVEDLIENSNSPQHVEPLIAPDGLDIRLGCGDEYFTKPGVEIVADPQIVHWFSLPYLSEGKEELIRGTHDSTSTPANRSPTKNRYYYIPSRVGIC